MAAVLMGMLVYLRPRGKLIVCAQRLFLTAPGVQRSRSLHIHDDRVVRHLGVRKERRICLTEGARCCRVVTGMPALRRR